MKLIDFETLQINCKQKFYRYSSGSLNSGEKVCKLQNNGLYHEKCNKEHCPIWNGLPDAELTARELLEKIKHLDIDTYFQGESTFAIGKIRSILRGENVSIDEIIKKVEGENG